MNKGPKQPATQTTTTKQEPWAPAASLISSNLFPAAQTAFANTPRTPYEGDFYAGPTTAQTQGNQSGIDFATNLQANPPNIGGNSMDFINQLLGTSPRTPSYSQVGAPTYGAPATSFNQQGAPNYSLYEPGARDISARFETELAPLMRRFEEQVIPQFVTDITGAGAYDNSRSNQLSSQLFRDQLVAPATETLGRLTYEEEARRQDIQNQNSQMMAQLQQGDAARLSGENLNFASLLQQGVLQGNQLASSDAARLSGENLGMAQLIEQALQGQTGQQLQGASQLPAMELGNLQGGLLPSQLLSGYGAEQQGWNQGELDAAIAQWNEQLAAPWRGVNEFANVAYGAPGGTSTSNSTAQTPNSSGGIGGAVAGGIGGGMLGSSVLGLTMAANPVMLPLLIALGALGGGFG